MGMIYKRGEHDDERSDQPKNHRRIIAHVAAIGASKRSASRITVSI